MESLSASTLNVVLKIRDGSGFGFLTSPFIITCSLNGNSLTTDPLGGSTNSTFENEFVWEAEKKFLRSMRSNNYSIRVECFSDTKHKKHDKIGYILLNMKQQAQIISPSLCTNIVYNWHKLLGVRSDVKTYKPEILLSLFIKEADFELNPKTPPAVAPSNKSEEVGKTVSIPCLPTAANMPIESTNPANSIQLGSPRETDYHFKLCVRITSLDNISACLKDSGANSDLRFEFALFGDCFKTSDLSSKDGQLKDECVVITVKSQVETLLAYFTQFPSLNFLLQSDGTTIASTHFDIKGLLAREKFDELLSEKVVVIHDEHTLHLSSESSLTVFISLEAERVKVKNPIKPFTVDNVVKKGNNNEINLPNKPNVRGVSCKTVNNAPEIPVVDDVKPPTSGRAVEPSQFSRAVEPSQFSKAVEPSQFSRAVEHPQCNMVPESLSNEPYSSSHHVKELTNHLNLQTMKNFNGIGNFNEMTQSTPQFVYPYFEPKFPNFQDGRGDSCEVFPPKTAQDLTESVKNKIAEELAKKTYEELEEWKEKQKESYKAELKKKLDKEIKRLTAEWLSRQNELEREATTNIEESVSLSQQLHTTSAELKLKLETINKQQAQLEKEKEEMEKKYAEKHHELREASKKHQTCMQQQITALKEEIEELKAKSCSLLKENEMLKCSQESCNRNVSGNTSQLTNKSSHLTDQQMTSLLVDMKSLEEKLSAAIESKEFFRKEWSQALREIHRMKTEQEEQVRLQLQTQRQELDNLRLVGLLTSEEKSSKEDLASIKDLKNQISRLHTPKLSQ